MHSFCFLLATWLRILPKGKAKQDVAFGRVSPVDIKCPVNVDEALSDCPSIFQKAI
jgi:hypothetical protein